MLGDEFMDRQTFDQLRTWNAFLLSIDVSHFKTANDIERRRELGRYESA